MMRPVLLASRRAAALLTGVCLLALSANVALAADIPTYEEQQRRKELARVEASYDDDFRPPLMEELQDVRKYAKDPGLYDDFPTADLELDIRRDAMREAALSYGARGGLSARNFEMARKIEGYGPGLDKIYDFRQLLIRTHSGMMIEPPIVSESDNTLIVTKGGEEAAVADKFLHISKRAKIVTAPRDWRHYVIQPYGEVVPPPKILWPENEEEQANWDKWIKEGWDEGFKQADETFETNLNRLVADFQGMVRYRTLLAQGMITAPYAVHADRGVTGSQTGETMRVGDRALRITGPSKLLTGSEAWKPADR